MEKIIGIGEYAVSDKESDIIKIFALASCVAVSAYSPTKKAAGMIHVALPAPLNKNDIFTRPCYFATTGIPKFIDSMVKQYGCTKDELIIGVYGGADSVKNDDLFNIGKRNINAARITLEGLNLKIRSMEIDGTLSRTLEMSVATGVIRITTHPITI